jgi:hypothetical protein
MYKRNIVRYSFAAALVVVAFSAWFIFYVDPFLARSSPVNAEMLIIEAWVDTRYMRTAVQEFRKGKYRHIFVVGDSQSSGSQGKSADDVERIMDTLIQLDIAPSLITGVPVPPKKWHKTWSQALTFRNYIARSNYPIKAVNVFTLGVHARKSQLLYQRAVGPDIQVGVISVTHYGRSSGHWWLTIGGIYGVAKNSVAYVDALLQTVWGDNDIKCSN